MNKKELWLKIKAYHFEHVVPTHLWNHVTQVFGGAEATTKAFAVKVARKAGWKPGFALKAIAEYKKFVYLAVVSDFNVTPSKVIDKVWHQHLLFTKAYRQFCSEVINYTLDHHPELIAITGETGTFNAQYLDTLALYKKEFGSDPPADIWGIPKFDQEKVEKKGYTSRKKKSETGTFSYTIASDTSALISFFSGSAKGGNSFENFLDTGSFGGGHFGGGGAGGSWSDSGGDSGGSSCSSGCGGGD